MGEEKRGCVVLGMGHAKEGTWQLEGSWHANTLAICVPVVEKSFFRIAMGDARVTGGV
jgi:hypothetical protein